MARLPGFHQKFVHFLRCSSSDVLKEIVSFFFLNSTRYSFGDSRILSRNLPRSARRRIPKQPRIRLECVLEFLQRFLLVFFQFFLGFLQKCFQEFIHKLFIGFLHQHLLDSLQNCKSGPPAGYPPNSWRIIKVFLLQMCSL